MNPIAIKTVDIHDPAYEKHLGEMKALEMEQPHAENLAIAKDICKTIRESYISYGSNSKANSHPSLTFQEKTARIQELRKAKDEFIQSYFIRHSEYPSEELICEKVASLLKTYQFGYCGELIRAGFHEAKKFPVSGLALCETTHGKHGLLVIGDITWNFKCLIPEVQFGENAVVCDIWTGKCYSFSQFRRIQEQERIAHLKDGSAYNKDHQDSFNPPFYLGGDVEIFHA